MPRSLRPFLFAITIVSVFASALAQAVSPTSNSSSTSLTGVELFASSSAVASSVDAISADDLDGLLGRWKLNGTGGCVWAPNDSGSNQCNPNAPDGRYKITSTGCVWDATQFGADQCNPSTYGRYKLDGNGGCVWVANDIGSNQCTPSSPDGRYKITSAGCVWVASEFGDDQCNPATYGRYKINSTGGCSWVANDIGPNQCDPNTPDGRYKINSQGGCTWAANEFGPDQCNPADYGRYKINSTGSCYWDANDMGTDQCNPNNPDGRHKLNGIGVCYWEPSEFGPDDCTPTPPPANTYVFLVNGSFTETPATWTVEGSPMSNAVKASYGVTPVPFPWTTNAFHQVIALNDYQGIWDGGFELANFLSTLPPEAEINLISHSHGGNVVLTSQRWIARPIRRYIQLATPVNFDFGVWRYALNYGIEARCQVSSASDWIQFFGSSPTQKWNWAVAMAVSYAGAQVAYDALAAGDWEAAFAWFAAAGVAGMIADDWFWSAKIEVEGLNFKVEHVGHSAMHEPWIWNGIAPFCK